MEAELYDGTVLEFPDGTDPSVVQQVVKRETNRRRVAGVEPQAAIQAGEGLRDVPRQTGLAARYAIEGGGSIPATLANIPAMAANGYLELANLAAKPFGGSVDFRFPEQNQALSDALTRLGLPQPRNANERVVGDMARTFTGAMTGIGAANRVVNAGNRVVSSVAERVAANPSAQAAAAVGAGGAGGSVREAGGGPTEQFVASILGGLAGGGAYALAAPSVGRGLATVEAAAKKALAPRDIQAAVNIELQRAGVDWNALSAEAQRKIVKDVATAIYTDQPIDRAALARLADYRNIGARPLVGDITQDPRAVTYQRNLSKTQANTPPIPGAPDLPSIENQNARTVLSTLQGVESSPLDAFGTGQRVQGVLTGRDAAMQATEKGLYDAARESAGRTIPLDREGFVYGAFNKLAEENKGAFLPKEIQSILRDILKGTKVVNGRSVEVPFNVDTIDNLKTTLATAQRSSNDGNVRRALGIVRQSLEDAQPRATGRPTGSTMPVDPALIQRAQGQADALSTDSLNKFDAARSAARQRRTWQESAAFIEDALEGTDPAKYTNKHVVNADYADLAKLRAELGNDQQTIAAVRKQLVNYILERGKADSDTVKFTSAGLKAAFDQIGERKLRLFFDAREVQQIRSAINVARYSQSQPIGSAVNNSNSAAMLIGRMMTALINAGTAVPVAGPLIAQPLQRATVSVQGMSAARVPNSLALQMPPEPFPLNPLIALPLLPPAQQ